MSGTTWRRLLLPGAAALLAGLTLRVYWSGLGGPFMLDDFGSIHPLAAMQAQGASWWDILQSVPHQIRGRWLSNFSFLLTNLAAGNPPLPSAYAYKFGNLLVHLGCAAVLALLAHALARAWKASAGQARAVALLAAALFALHPLLVSTVLYPVQRMAQLATLFALLACWAYMQWRQNLGRGNALADHARLARVMLFMGLSLLGKETGALTPLLILVIELCAFRWPAPTSPVRSRFEGGFGLACAGPLVLGAVTLALRWNEFTAAYELRDFTLVERLMTQVHVVAGYATQILWPRVGEMGVYHDDVAVVRGLQLSTILLALSFAACIALAIAARRRFPGLAFGVLWFFAAHVLESTVIPLELVFEHRNYMALAGVAIGAACLITRLPTRIGALAFSALLVGALAVQTDRRSEQWSTFANWVEAEARNHPGSLRAGTDLFVHHLRRSNPASAIAERDRLAAALPTSLQPVLLKLGFACRGPIAIGLFTPDELAQLAKAPIGKDLFHAYIGLRDTLAPNPQCDMDWQAFAAVSGAVAQNPAVISLPRARAAWLRLHAEASRNVGNWAAVEAAILQTVEVDASDPRDWLALMRARLELGDRVGYLQARMQLTNLIGNRPGAYATDLNSLDTRARGLGAQLPD